MVDAKKKKLSASLEDYLEAIFNLADESDIARSKNIAETLGVAKSSVTGALRELKKRELVNYKPYGYVTLTESGRNAAQQVVRKHNVLKAFFVNVLGIKNDIAQEAACKAEHSLGPEVIARLLAFIEFVTQRSANGIHLAEEFEQFCNNGSVKSNKKES